MILEKSAKLTHSNRLRFANSNVVDDAKNVATLCKSGSELCGALRITEVGRHELTRKIRRCVSRDADDFPAGG
jgi:hypothetical protein